jgi:hypothetical protein
MNKEKKNKRLVIRITENQLKFITGKLIEENITISKVVRDLINEKFLS